MSLETFVNTDASNLTTARCQSATDLGAIPFKAQAAGDQVLIDLYLTGQSGLENLQDYGSVRLGLGPLNARPESGTYIPDTGEDALQYNHSAGDLQTSVAIWAAANTAIEVTPFVFKVTFDAVGAQTLPTVDAALLDPASSVNVSRLVTGDGSTQEVWMWRIFRNPIALITDWINLGDDGLQGVLNLGTTGVYDLLDTNGSVTTFIELELTDSSGNISTVMQQAYTIAGEVIGQGASGVAEFETYATASDLAAKQDNIISAEGGVEAGTGSAADFGGAVGSGSTTVDGFAGGDTATSTDGSATGRLAVTTDGGAAGRGAESTTGGAVGKDSETTTGGSIGFGATSTNGFAAGEGAIAIGDNRVQLGGGINGTNNTIQFRGSGSVTESQFSTLLAAQRFPIFAASDFPATLVDGTQYDIYGAIAMGAVSPIFPAAGTRVTICGIGPGASLTSAENSYTMFTDVTNSGAVKFENISLSVTGTSSHLGNLTNNGTSAFVLDRVTVLSCTNAFTLSGHSFVSYVRSQDVLCANGHTIDGTIQGIDMTQYGSFSMVSGGTVFSDGGSLSITGRVFLEGVFDIASGVTFCDFAPSSIVEDASLEVLFGQFSGAGTFFSNITESDVKSRWRDNNWPATATENNTYIGSRWELTSTAATVIASTGVYVKVAGTTTYGDEQWFSNTTDNAFVYDSTRITKVIIAGSLNVSAVSGGASKNLLATIRHWDDSASAYVDLPGTPRGTATSAGDIRNVSILTEADLDVDDRIELWIQNDTDTVNLTLETGSTLVVTERAN